MSTACPSAAWDRYCDEQDESQQARINWWRANKAHVVTIAAAILSNPNVDPFKMGESDVVEQAEKITLIISGNCQDPYTGEE